MIRRTFWTLALSLLLAAPALAQEDEPHPSREVSRARILDALERYRREPSAVATARAALRAQRANVARVGDAMDRARATGWLPTVRAGVRRGQGVDLRSLGVNADLNVSTDDDLTLDATMTFRFDRIAFAPEEVGLLRELRAVEYRQAELVHLVITLYFERRRLQLERDVLGNVEVVREVRILEIEALLDALTDGAFVPEVSGNRDGLQ